MEASTDILYAALCAARSAIVGNIQGYLTSDKMTLRHKTANFELTLFFFLSDFSVESAKK